MKKDEKYVIIKIILDDGHHPLVAISPISETEDKTDSLYLFWMSEYERNFIDVTDKHNLIIDGVDLV